MQIVKPKHLNHDKKGVYIKHSLLVTFEMSVNDLKNKNMSLVLCNGLGTLLENIMDSNDILLSHMLFYNENNINYFYHPSSSSMTIKTNNYFCQKDRRACDPSGKKSKRKIKYKNDCMKIPLLYLSCDDEKYNMLAIWIDFFLPCDFYQFNDTEQYFKNSVTIELKNNKKCVYNRFNYQIFDINDKNVKYIFVTYKHNWLKKHGDNVIDIWNYDHIFYKLIDEYSNISLKIKETNDGAIIIFSSDEDTYLTTNFLQKVWFAIPDHIRDKNYHFCKPYIIF